MKRSHRVKKDLSCYLCAEKVNFAKRHGKVRDNPALEIYECLNCGLVFLSSFDHITNRFYEASGMHVGKLNIDQWIMDTAWDDERRFNYLRQLIENKAVLDFGCGNGGFLLRAKKLAAHVAGIEVEAQLKNYFEKRNLSIFANIKETVGTFDIITLFHVLEHIPNPIKLLRQLSDKLNPGGHLIVEVPNANDVLLSLYNNKPFSRFTYWSCHLFLFNAHNLSIIGQRAGFKTNYVKQIQRYPLSNHLYWLSNGKPGGHKVWNFLDSEALRDAYEKQLASLGCCDTIIGSFSKS